MPQKHEIYVTDDDRTIEVGDGTNLLEALQEKDYELPSLCGGMGLCGKCRVRIIDGAGNPTESDRELFSDKELEEGMRLSCRTKVENDLKLSIPSLAQGKSKEATAKSELDEQLVDVKPDSGIETQSLDLEVPGRGDQRSDASRITDELSDGQTIPLEVLKGLPSTLRENDYSVSVTFDRSAGQVLSVRPRDESRRALGMTFDIGTTTVAAYGLDLDTGWTLNVNSMENPQGKFGADVVSRIKYVRENKGGLERLQEEIVRAVNGLIDDFVDDRRINREGIYRATFVGNTIMLHLFAGVDPTHLDQSPYIPGFTESQEFRAEELGIEINPRGKLVLLPSLAGYVGADVMAGILQTGMHRSDELSLLVDIGTNGEMALGNKDRIYAASTAAGPAFEGANIEQGMTARAGAISHVSITEEGQLEIEVIKDKKPIGLCGSGIVDTVGELLKAGLIEEKGNIVSEKSVLPRPTINPLGNRLIEMDGEKAFWLHVDHNPVFVTQQDVREVQLAKGAIKAGIEILLEEFGASPGEVDKVYLAGAFGNYLRKENIMRIGVLPDIDLGKIVSVGNAAGQGGKMALMNRGKMEEVEEVARNVEYIELSFRSDFSEKFMSAMSFPGPKE